MDSAALAQALFAALEQGDEETVYRLCTSDMRVTQNQGPAMTIAALLRYTHTVIGAIPDFHYEQAQRSATDTGFVEEHVVCGTLPDGTALRLPVCVVADVVNGKVSRVREYADSFAARGLLRALTQ